MNSAVTVTVVSYILCLKTVTRVFCITHRKFTNLKGVSADIAEKIIRLFASCAGKVRSSIARMYRSTLHLQRVIFSGQCFIPPNFYIC